MVELKMPRRYRRHNVVARTVRLLGPDDVLVSFQRPALVEARLLRPGLRTVQHVVGGPLRRARESWAVGFADTRVSERRVAAARALGLETLVYTVNDPARMRALDEAGVSGIFTDDPELALRALRGS
jgi:glycerophosphoryl diester phosphodiesterase